LTNTKLHSPWPYLSLTALMGLIPVLNNKYPAAFFPAAPGGLVDLVCVLLGVLAAFLGFSRLWNRLQHGAIAKALLTGVIAKRQALEKADESEASQSGRIVSRLVRNVDEDLKEIKPDFTWDSLKRLQGVFGLLLEEIEDEQDALIRLGVVGTYLGETACRNEGWQWFFKTDPTLRQFSYLASVLRKDRREADPYLLAAQWLTGQKGLSEIKKGLE